MTLMSPNLPRCFLPHSMETRVRLTGFSKECEKLAKRNHDGTAIAVPSSLSCNCWSQFYLSW